MLDEMRTFVILAESGSLRRAVERLFLTPDAGFSIRLGALFEPHSRRNCAKPALRSKSPPGSTISTCRCRPWRAELASASSPRAFSPRIRSAGGWSRSRVPASALRLRSCSCKPATGLVESAATFLDRSFEATSRIESFVSRSPSRRPSDRSQPVRAQEGARGQLELPRR
jgi:hypothetical protein